VDAIELMKEDHARISQLFDAALANLDPQARSGLLQQIRADLMTHEKMKQDIFYPALRSGGDQAKDIVIEGEVEHHVIAVIADSLEEVPEDVEQWRAKLKVLKASLDEHIRNEEERVFSRARPALGRERLEQLGHEMATFKNRQGATPNAAGPNPK